jgi:hypothetical protein
MAARLVARTDVSPEYAGILAAVESRPRIYPLAPNLSVKATPADKIVEVQSSRPWVVTCLVEGLGGREHCHRYLRRGYRRSVLERVCIRGLGYAEPQPALGPATAGADSQSLTAPPRGCV